VLAEDGAVAAAVVELAGAWATEEDGAAGTALSSAGGGSGLAVDAGIVEVGCPGAPGALGELASCDRRAITRPATPMQTATPPPRRTGESRGRLGGREARRGVSTEMLDA
jgi:hypothetical protein